MIFLSCINDKFIVATLHNFVLYSFKIAFEHPISSLLLPLRSLERVDIAASRHAGRTRDRSLESSSFYGMRDVPMPDPYRGATRETLLDGLPDSYRRGANPIMDNR